MSHSKLCKDLTYSFCFSTFSFAMRPWLLSDDKLPRLFSKRAALSFAMSDMMIFTCKHNTYTLISKSINSVETF